MLNLAFVGSATGRDAAEQHVKAGPLTPKGRDRQLLHKARDLYILCTTPHAWHKGSRHQKHKFAETEAGLEKFWWYCKIKLEIVTRLFQPLGNPQNKYYCI